MSKRRMTGLATIVMLIGAALLVAQPGGRGGQPGAGERMRPPGGPMGQFFADLERAYEQKDMDKIGQLIEQMKQRRRQFQGRAGGRGVADPPPGMPGRFGPRGRGQSLGDKPPLGRNDREKEILAVLDDMDTNQRRGMMNVPVEDGRLLRLLAETTGAKNIVEIGTSNGYSGIWQCLALKTTGGRLTTFEINAQRAALARQNFQRAGVDDIVTLIEGDAHEKVMDLSGSIDIVFVDADKEGYLDYLNKLLPKVRPGGLIIAHNINPGQADPRYVEAVTTNPDLETVFYSQAGGVSVTMKKRDLR